MKSPQLPDGEATPVAYDRAEVERVLEVVERLDEAELDALPCGLIKLDPAGNILSYNQTEAELAQINRRRLIGKNFFDDVAPCARVKIFQGRFVEGVAKQDLNETFGFLFRFPHGSRYVAITLFYSRAMTAVYVVLSHATAS